MHDVDLEIAVSSKVIATLSEDVARVHHDLASFIRSHRLARGWTQLDLAVRCEVSPEAVNQWESGILIPSSRSISQLVKALELGDDGLGILTRLVNEEYVLQSDNERLISISEAVKGHVIIAGDSAILVDNTPEGSPSRIPSQDVNQSSVRVLSSDQAFERIAAAVALNLRQLEKNMDQARRDSSHFFKLTLVFVALGSLILIIGIGLSFLDQITTGVITAASGLILDFASLLFFRKDKELRKTMEIHDKHILKSQQMLTMIDVAETIKDDDGRDKMKQQIIYKALGIEDSS